MKKLILAVLALGILGSGTYLVHEYRQQQKLEGPDAPDSILLEDLLEGKKSIDDLPRVQEELPTSINIDLPFYTQAPYSNWDYPWQEACEEASVLLVANVYKGLNLDREAYNTELLRLIDWEIGYFGAYEHTTVAQTAEMIKIQYGLETVIHDNPTFEDFQEILADGHLIIAPFAGKYLGNPNYLNGGPIYHMMVVKGYDAEKMQIVTHDVGTRNGADYVYDWAVIENALHDWNNTDMLKGTPRIIEVLPGIKLFGPP
ncbi:MAG: C39 family peptidase [Candidatus Gracilibacteria bacterium]